MMSYRYSCFLLCGCLSLAGLARPVRGAGVVRGMDVGLVWSGDPVNFALLTDAKRSVQYVAYYDADRQMTVASRGLPSGAWKVYKVPAAEGGPPTRTGWDSHNYLAMAVDGEGQLHLSGNMHAAPLLYYRTTRAGDITSLAAINQMVGTREGSATYPRFIHGPGNELVFAYRDGRSGQGDDIYDRYDGKTERWTRLLDQPLLDGQGKMNAYSVGPVTDASGGNPYYHLTWVWRDTPDCSSNHDLSYARSKDLVHWENAAGKALTLPITVGPETLVDPVPVKGGMINNNTLIGFDPEHRAVIAYHKNDAEGTQLFLARFDAGTGKWQVAQESHWHYTWDFSGNGSMIFEITVHPPETLADGRFVASATHLKLGEVGFVVDPATLKPVGSYAPAPVLPEGLMKPESDYPGMTVNTVEDSGSSGEAGVRYVLRWETLAQNRDRPRRGALPGPTMLRVYEVGGR